VLVLSGRTDKVIATIPIAPSAAGAAVSPLTGDAYATNSDGANVWVVSG